MTVFPYNSILYLHTLCTGVLGWKRDPWAPTVPASCGARSKRNPLMISFYSILIRFPSIFKSICPNLEAYISYLRSKQNLFMISFLFLFIRFFSIWFEIQFLLKSIHSNQNMHLCRRLYRNRVVFSYFILIRFPQISKSIHSNFEVLNFLSWPHRGPS